MSGGEVLDLAREATWVLIVMAGPTMIIGLIVGVAIGLAVVGVLSVPITVFFPAYSYLFFAPRYAPLASWMETAPVLVAQE